MEDDHQRSRARDSCISIACDMGSGPVIAELVIAKLVSEPSNHCFSDWHTEIVLARSVSLQGSESIKTTCIARHAEIR